MILARKLEQIGLTDKEARVYVALLEIGESTAQHLALKSGINRATTYVMLESLIKKGLVNSVNKQKKTFYYIESPLQLLEILYKQKDELNEKISVAKRIMPEVEMLERLTGERPKVKFYEGKQGIALIRKNFLKTKYNTIDVIFNVNDAFKLVPREPGDHRDKILQGKLKDVRNILIYDPKQPIPYFPVYKGEDRRYLPANKFPFGCEFIFFPNKVAMIVSREHEMGIVIENNILVQALKTLFDLAWAGAEKYKAVSGGKVTKKKP